MPTALRIDAPDDVRRFDARFRSELCGGLLTFAVIMALVGVLVLLVGVAAGSWPAAIIGLVWIVATAGPMARVAYRMRTAVRRWRVPVNLGADQILVAHELYWKLSPEARRNYALPLIETMYRLSVIGIAGSRARQRVEATMQNRVFALRDLIDAEDSMRLFEADATLRDRDDIDAAEAWNRAVAQVEEQLRSDLTEPGRDTNPGDT